MKFRKGDKVFFIGDNSKYSWKLNKYEEYEICGMSYKNDQFVEFYYGVKNKKGTETTWYEEEDFITIKQLRKLKLDKLNESRFVFE